MPPGRLSARQPSEAAIVGGWRVSAFHPIATGSRTLPKVRVGLTRDSCTAAERYRYSFHRVIDRRSRNCLTYEVLRSLHGSSPNPPRSVPFAMARGREYSQTVGQSALALTPPSVFLSEPSMFSVPPHRRPNYELKAVRRCNRFISGTPHAQDQTYAAAPIGARVGSSVSGRLRWS